MHPAPGTVLWALPAPAVLDALLLSTAGVWEVSADLSHCSGKTYEEANEFSMRRQTLSITVSVQDIPLHRSPTLPSQAPAAPVSSEHLLSPALPRSQPQDIARTHPLRAGLLIPIFIPKCWPQAKAWRLGLVPQSRQRWCRPWVSRESLGGPGCAPGARPARGRAEAAAAAPPAVPLGSLGHFRSGQRCRSAGSLPRGGAARTNASLSLSLFLCLESF